MNRKLVWLVIGTLGSVASAFAHHSFSATYDDGKQMQIEGTLVQFMGRNPIDRRLRMQTLYRAADDFGWGIKQGDID